MQELDVVRQTRRFIMFDELTQKKVIKLVDFFNRYVFEFSSKKKYAFTYYDTKNKDLEKSAILLYRTTLNNKSTLTMSLEQRPNQGRFLEMINSKKIVRDIGTNESILKNVDFLRNSFKDMFKGALAFDPDYLLKKLTYAYTIETVSEEYKIISAVGLKAKFMFDLDTYFSNETGRKVQLYTLIVDQLSNEKTNGEFDDLMSKLERYCKELTPTDDTKIKLARKYTRALPKLTKEQERKFIEEQKQATEQK